MTDDPDLYIESEWTLINREKERLRRMAKEILREFPDDNIPDCDDPEQPVSMET